MKTEKKPDRIEVNDEAYRIALDYIYYRLQKNDYTWYRCPELPDPQRPCLIMRELGDEFERRFAKQYGELSLSLHASKFTTYLNFWEVCDELFRGQDYRKVDGEPEVKWSRIVALFVFGGVLAVEFTKNGLDDQLVNIAKWIYIYVRDHLSFWICKHGGWDGLIEYYETRELNKTWDNVKETITSVGIVCGVVALAVVLEWRLSR